MKSISLILAHCFLFQSLIFGSGWFCGLLAGEIKLCECNHGSGKEKHAAAEDSRFENKLVSEDGDEEHSHSSLPDCHSAKSGETHKCSCKKAKDKASALSGSICAQFYSSPNSEYTGPKAVGSELLAPFSESIGVQIPLFLERPPRFS